MEERLKANNSPLNQAARKMLEQLEDDPEEEWGLDDMELYSLTLALWGVSRGWRAPGYRDIEPWLLNLYQETWANNEKAEEVMRFLMRDESEEMMIEGLDNPPDLAAMILEQLDGSLLETQEFY